MNLSPASENSVSRPASLFCRKCSISVPVKWESVGQDIWFSQGRCPSCRSVVASFISDSGFSPALVSRLAARLS